MWVAPDQSQMEGRWFWGSYEEFGYDVTLRRAGEGATVMSVDRTMLKTGSTGQRVKIDADQTLHEIAEHDQDRKQLGRYTGWWSAIDHARYDDPHKGALPSSWMA